MRGRKIPPPKNFGGLAELILHKAFIISCEITIFPAKRQNVGRKNRYSPIAIIEQKMSCSDMMPIRSAKHTKTMIAVNPLMKPLPQPTR